MADRSKRNERAKQDRVELAEYRKVVRDTLSVAEPSPEILREHLSWTNKLCDFINTIGLRRKPYFDKQDIPK